MTGNRQSDAELGVQVTDAKQFSNVTSRFWNFMTEIQVNEMMSDVWVRHRNVWAGSCSIANFSYRGKVDAFARRTHQNIRSDNAELYILTLPQKGFNNITQHGRNAVIDNCQFILTGAGTPYCMGAQYDDNDEHDSIHLMFPSNIARNIYPAIDELLCKPFPLREGKSRLARDIIVSLANEGRFLPSDSNQAFASLAVQTIIESIAAPAEDMNGEAGLHKQAKFQIILSYVQQHRSDPDLSVAKTARALGISASYVHALLRAHGTSFQKCVWDERFASAYQKISDERFAERTIASIAFSEGFKSNAHFAREFRNRFGMRPMDLRRKSLN